MSSGVKLRLPVVALLATMVLIAACGGDDDEATDGLTAQGVVDSAKEAILKPGVVYHAVGDDGSEVWVDADGQRFRRIEPTTSGSLTSVGQGWIRWSYDPFTNVVEETDLSPEGGAPRIDHPIAGWFEPISAIAYGTELRLIGNTTADGLAVVALQAESPISNQGELSGNVLRGRIELDATTYLPHAFEREEAVPTGQTPQGGAEGSEARKRIVYQSEEISIADIPEGFFDRAVVDGLVQTVEENIQKTRNIGLIPYWLGEQLNTERGLLQLPLTDNLFVDENAGEAQIHYSLILPLSQTEGEPVADTVIIRLAHGIDNFNPPVLQAFAGDLPEAIEDLEARGARARLITSHLTPADLPCPENNCPTSDVPLYRRLILTIGETSVQIETSARVDALGKDRNGYNTRDGIVALAEALAEAQG